MDSAADTLAGGLPHSDISGSKNATVSPELFAGCHVLHRLLSPRHSPGALNSLENPYAQTPQTFKWAASQHTRRYTRSLRASAVKIHFPANATPLDAPLLRRSSERAFTFRIADTPVQVRRKDLG